MSRSPLVVLLGLGLGIVGLSQNVGREIHIPVGSARGPVMMSGLGPSVVANGLAAEELADARRDFYFRQIESDASHVDLPLIPLGPTNLAIRFDTTVRTHIEVKGGGRTVGDSFVPPGPWKESEIASGASLEHLAFTIDFTNAPLVRRSDEGNFRRYVDEFVVRSDAGFKLPWSSRISGGLLAAALILVCESFSAGIVSSLAAVVLPAALLWLALAEPVAVSLALPRLLGFAILAIVMAFALARLLAIGGSSRAALSLLAVGVILGCGFLSFLPNHSPADLDIHIWRTLDLADVPMTYDGWLRYGSHYPTPSQIRGSATETLGEGPAIPYSPLPYFVFYAAHAVGLDLHWSMNAIEALSLVLLLPLVFAVARAASSEGGGLLAAVLMALDLATIHHLGRAHFPAVLGGALGLSALLWFGLALPALGERGHWRTPAFLLGLGALGYSSTPLFYGLCGVALMILLLMQDETRALFKPVLISLCVGGGLALALYYAHYIPGLLKGSDTTPLADAYPGRTFFIFHNESRQSLRLWRLGLFVPLLGAIPAALFVARRCSGAMRSFLLAWLAAWCGIMLLKEPWGFPLLLRWAKEDFYVAPGLALLIAVAIAKIETRTVRTGLIVVAVVTAFYLRVNDYGFHADTLRFMR